MRVTCSPVIKMKGRRRMWEAIPSAKPGLWQIMNREDLWSDRVADPLGGTCNARSVALSRSLLISKITFCPLFGCIWRVLTPLPPPSPKQDVPSCWLSTPEWVLSVGRIEQTPSESVYFLRNAKTVAIQFARRKVLVRGGKSILGTLVLRCPLSRAFPSSRLPNQSASCREKEASVSLSQQVIASPAIPAECQALHSS